MSSHSPPRFALRYAHWVIRLRYPLIAVILLGTVIASLAIPNIDLRNDPDTLLPAHNQHVLTNAFVEQTFGMSNFIVVGLEVRDGDIFQPWFINKLRRLHHRLEGLPDARPDNFISLAAKKARAIQGGPDGLDIHRLIPRTGIDEQDPATAQRQLDALRRGLTGNVAIRDMLVSADRKAAFVIADFATFTIGSAVPVSVFTAMTVLPILIRAAVTLPIKLYQSSNLPNLQVSERTRQLRREKEELTGTQKLSADRRLAVRQSRPK